MALPPSSTYPRPFLEIFMDLSTAVGEAEVEYFLEVLNACLREGDSAD